MLTDKHGPSIQNGAEAFSKLRARRKEPVGCMTAVVEEREAGRWHFDAVTLVQLHRLDSRHRCGSSSRRFDTQL
jgi:hypothetical protein